MEDFRFSSENNLLKNISDSCWHVKNNNNNLLDDSSSASQSTFHSELLPDELNTQRKQQRKSATATKASLGGSSSGLGVISCSGVGGGSIIGIRSGDGGGILLAKGGKQKNVLMNTTTTTSSLSSTTEAADTSGGGGDGVGASITPTYVCRIEDEGGGAANIGADIGLLEQTDKQQQQQQNGAATPASCYSQQQQQQVVAAPLAAAVTTPIKTIAMSNMIRLPSLSCDLDLESYGGIGATSTAVAASLSPTEAGAAMAMTAGIGSNRTSINNSTENLSYSSDNYYPDDLILLDDDDDDGEAEEISLNSDDCVYAYRGDGADFELAALDANLGRGGLAMDGIGGGIGIVDDETEFLEMDFEPDPLSEVEFASISGAGGGCIDGSSVDHANLFLMQRDFSQLSGRHSANMSLQVTPTQRQHFSSPIDDLPPQEALQSQAQRLNKNFARISLHLDQIKGDSSADDGNDLDYSRCDSLRNKRLCSNECLDKLGQSAHSLPNTLYSSFEREHNIAPVVTTATLSSLSTTESEKIPSKVTGAKPKRLSTFSSSSVSSKNSSSKSRNSLRSAFAPHASNQQHGNSASFDERSVSCTDFRSSGGSGVDTDCTPMLAVAAAAVVAAAAATAAANVCNFDLSTNDEPCLDCLEKEFLANTIGKPVDLSGCPKCAHKRSSSISLYTQAQEQTRCRSGSPSYFMELRDDCLFNASNMPTPRKRYTEWSMPTTTNKRLWDYGGAGGDGIIGGVGNAGIGGSSNFATCSTGGDNVSGSVTAKNNQRVSNSTKCDNRGGVQLFPQNFMEPLVVVQSRLTTTEMSEASLMAALDKLKIKYNTELIHEYFQQPPVPIDKYKNLKDFILYSAKQPNNKRKIEKLIELATQQDVSVEFKPDDTNLNVKDEDKLNALVPVNVSDILKIWERSKDLSQLQTLDERFHDANTFGKIANIVRQAQQRIDSSPGSSKRSPLPDFIMIPQYYPHGEFILRRKS